MVEATKDDGGEERYQTAGEECGAVPISNLRNNKRQSLGPEWSISGVRTPLPHNSDKTHGLVASINNSINIVYFELQFIFTKRDVNKFLG